MSTPDGGPWAAYRPGAKDPWDLRKVAHLHRRAGFGATRAELLRDLKDGPEASVTRFLEPGRPAPDARRVTEVLRQGALRAGDPERLQAWWLYRILNGHDPLREKMTLFWHGHFATSNAKVQSVPLMLRQNELFRRHALGSFGELLAGAVADPAMLVWLDGGSSRKELPNENFAREFLELFTLGVGHYAEKDVREAARAFTGWSGSRGRGFRFDRARADVGRKTFLKQSGTWEAGDVVRITLEQPRAAEFLCRKLYRFLVSERREPPAGLIAPLAEELRRSRYSVGGVVGVILRSRHFYGADAYRQRVKSPVEFSAGLARALEPATRAGPAAVALACARQGQELFAPPSVKGWDGGKAWVNSLHLVQRGNWASEFVWGNPDSGVHAYDAPAWAGKYGLSGAEAAAAFIELLAQDVSPKARGLILAAGRAGKAGDLRKAVQLVLHCPEYQLA
jgi:uncharacterized protein (DUF1800 family)